MSYLQYQRERGLSLQAFSLSSYLTYQPKTPEPFYIHLRNKELLKKQQGSSLLTCILEHDRAGFEPRLYLLVTESLKRFRDLVVLQKWLRIIDWKLPGNLWNMYTV